MLRSLVPLLLVSALAAQDQAPPPNYEVACPDLPALLQASGTLPMARAMREPELAGYVADAAGVAAAHELVAAALEVVLPGLDWPTITTGAKAFRAQGFATKGGNQGDWMIARITTTSEDVAGAWHAAVREAAPAGAEGAPAFPDALAGADWVMPGVWLARQGADLVLGYQPASMDHGLRAFGEPLGATLVEPRAGAVGVLELRGRFGLLLESFLSGPQVPGELASFFDGLGDAHAHARMDAVAPSGDQPGRILTRIRRDPGSSVQTSELESAFGVEPLDAAWLKGLPTGAMFTCVTTIDAARAVPALLAGSDVVALDWAALEEGLGFSPDRVWARMGPRVSIWAQPISGPAIPPTFAVIGLDDPEAFRADWDVLLQALASQLGDLEVRTRDYKVKDAALGKRIAIPITTLRSSSLSMNAGGFDLSVNPAMCIDDGVLVVASSSSRLKKELKRRHAGEADLGLDLSAHLAASGFEGATTAWQFDYVAMLDGLLGLARLAGGMGGDMVPIDLSNLPTTASLAKHVRPTFHAQGVDAKGRWIVHEASFGPETWMGLVGGVRKVMDQMAARMESMFEEAATPVPAAASPVEVTQTAFLDLRVGITVYEISHGKAPASLDDLLTTTADFPEGFLDADALPVDGWGNAFHYEILAEGGYRLWSAGPDGVDQKGAGDDVVSQG